MFRIGIGHDTHRLAEGRPLMLGGVRVESERGAEGHSDADALAHALTDAVLGAMCEGDIGQHFPDNDPRWQGADSLQLLARVMWLASERGYRVVNADATVMIERPRLRPYVQEMRERLAEVLGVGAADGRLPFGDDDRRDGGADAGDARVGRGARLLGH